MESLPCMLMRELLGDAAADLDVFYLYPAESASTRAPFMNKVAHVKPAYR